MVERWRLAAIRFATLPPGRIVKVGTGVREGAALHPRRQKGQNPMLKTDHTPTPSNP